MWFVFYLFLYSALALPLFLALRRGAGGWLDRLARTPRVLISVTACVYALVYALLTIPFPGPQNLVDDWGRFASYFLLFVFGFVVQARPCLGDAINARRRFALQLGAVCALVLYALRWNQVDWQWGMNAPTLAYMILRGATGFFFMVAILGYARRHLSRGGAVLRYANEAVYPFYILHQTVILIVGYYVVRSTDTILAKFAFTSIVSFALSLGLYELFVRNNPLLRPLFGMKPVRGSQRVKMAAPRPLSCRGAEPT